MVKWRCYMGQIRFWIELISYVISITISDFIISFAPSNKTGDSLHQLLLCFNTLFIVQCDIGTDTLLKVCVLKGMNEILVQVKSNVLIFFSVYTNVMKLIESLVIN